MLLSPLGKIEKLSLMLLVSMAIRASALSLSRRGFWGALGKGGAAAVVTTSALSVPSLPAGAIVAGDDVSLAEAAAAGAVGLWIDLDGCSVCRHDVPAACSGTLVAPDLVLSARHCLDVPEELNGTLTKVVFGISLFDPKAPTSAVVAVKTPADYGLDGEGLGDIVLIKLKTPAPATWRPQRLAFNLGETLKEELSSGGSDDSWGPTDLTELIGLPELTAYGFGDTDDDGKYAYSAGTLQKVALKATSAIGSKRPQFFTTPLPDKPGYLSKGIPTSSAAPAPSAVSAGTCNGDSGGAAIYGGGGSPGGVVLGVLSANSNPCAGSAGRYVNPDYGPFKEFILRASKDLGSPVRVQSKGAWRDLLYGKT